MPDRTWTTQYLKHELVSVGEITAQSPVLFYPNPVKSGACIHLKSVRGGSYQISDLQGRILLSGEVGDEDGNQIMLEHLAAGLYSFRLDTDGKSVTSKLLVR